MVGEIAMREINALPIIISGLGLLMRDSTSFVNTKAQELNAATAVGDLPGMRKAITGLAGHMNEMATQLAQHRRDYASSSAQAFQSFATAVSIVGRYGDVKTGSDGLRDKIKEAMETLRVFHTTTIALEKTITGIPNFAKDFNRARLSLKTEVRKLSDELARSLELMAKLLAAFEDSTGA